MEINYDAILQIHGLGVGILSLVVEICKAAMDDEELGREAMTVLAPLLRFSSGTGSPHRIVHYE
jgi:hypothetical protein